MSSSSKNGETDAGKEHAISSALTDLDINSTRTQISTSETTDSESLKNGKSLFKYQVI